MRYGKTVDAIDAAIQALVELKAALMAEGQGVAMEKTSYTIAELSELLGKGYSKTKLNRACASGALKSFIPNGRETGRRVKPEWVNEWLNGE